MMTYIPSIHTISDARESIQYRPNRFPSPSSPFGIGIPSTAKKTRTSRFTNSKKNETAILHRVLLTAMLCLMGWGEVWAYGDKPSYVYQNTSEKSASGWGEIKWEDPNSATVIFEATKNMYTAVGALRVDAYINGSWTEIRSIAVDELSKNNFKQFTIDVNGKNITGLKFTNEGSYTRTIKNIYVTRATNITATTTSLAFGSQSIGASTEKKASFSFNNTTYYQQVTGTCTDNHFTITPVDVGDTGSSSVNVTYSSTTPGVHSGTVTLSMNGATTTFTVSGSSTATYNFSATANPNYDSHGTASASVDGSITSTNSSETKTATFTATPNSGYEFVGWGTTAGATSYESTANPYQPTITNSKPGSTANKTLYAIFKPIFYFSVSAQKIYDHGSVSASVTDKTLGDPSATSLSTQATFTATPAEDCTFEGWYYDVKHEQLASKEATYTPTIINETVGSTKNLTLYAWFKQNQTLAWDTDITDFNLVSGTSVSSSATATSGLSVAYTTSNSSAATVDGEGVVTGVAPSNEGVVITASQAGNDEFNAATSITRTFNVLEKLQASFTENGENGFTSTNAKLKVGQSTTITASNIDEDFTCTSTSEEVVSFSREGNTITLTALKAGTSTVTLSQPANATHSASSAVYNITVEQYKGGLAITIPSAMQVGDTKTDFYTTSNNEVEVSVISSNTAVVQVADGILTAVGEGTATITVSQAETTKWAGESREQTIMVSKVNNTLGVSLAAQEAQVDGTIAVAFSNQNNTDTSILAEITERTLSSAVNNGTDVIVYSDGVITAKNAGTAKITFKQAATYKYTEYTSTTYEISVSKISNQISITLNEQSATTIKLKYGETATLDYSSSHSDAPIIVERTSGIYTTLTGNTITADNKAGTDLYEVKQAETYKYEAGYATFSIRVNNTTEEEMYIINDKSSYEDWTLTTLKSYSFEGHPGDVVIFEAKRTSGGSNSGFYLDYSTDNGATWQEQWFFISTDTDWKEYRVTLPEGVTHIRFELYPGSTLNKSVRNVRVTRKTYLEASADKTNFGTVYTGNTAQATVTVNYSTTNGGNILLSSSNGNFAVSQEQLATTENSDGTKTFTVTYTPNPEKLGAETATITVADLFYSQEIVLSATAEKQANMLSVVGEQNLKVGATVSNVFSDQNSYATLNVSTSSEGVISYDLETNTATAIGEGTTTLTFTQNANDRYYGTSQSVTFHVTKYDNTLGISLDKTALKVEETATVTFSSKISNGEITATFSTENIVSYENGMITAQNAGTTRITLTQAATTAYKEASQSFDITVTKHDQTLSWTRELSDAERTLSIGAVLTTNKATASSGLAVTYTSSNPAVLGVDENTGELKALSAGANITVTATQQGNNKYNEAFITRNFTVISKMDATVNTTLLTEGDNTLTIGKSPVTIGSNATLTESNFTITGNEEGYIKTSFANNTLTITPVKVGGNVTIILNRPEDDGYKPISKTYTLTVKGPSMTLSPQEAPEIQYPETVYSQITLQRTFKAGHSTITLPFDTRINALAVDDDSAYVAQLELVTYNKADEYTLYFKKVEDGTIRANRPYLIYLSRSVASPIVFKNVTAVQPQAADVIRNSWTMHGNYTPRTSMSGRYGIADGKLCLGSSNATINAYTAYFEAPTTQNVKVRVAVEDGGGNTTWLGETIEDEEAMEAVYGLDGMKLGTMKKGVNIVRQKDGTVKKVWKK